MGLGHRPGLSCAPPQNPGGFRADRHCISRAGIRADRETSPINPGRIFWIRADFAPELRHPGGFRAESGRIWTQSGRIGRIGAHPMMLVLAHVLVLLLMLLYSHIHIQ